MPDRVAVPSSPPSPEPRRIAAPTWLDLRLVFGIVLVLVAVLLGATVVSSASDTQPVVTAVRDLAVGTTLHADDLRVTQVQLPDDGRKRYVAELKRAVGRTLTRPVLRDELLPSAAIGSSAERTTLSVPLATAAAPELHAGQRIQLWLSTPTCAFVVLLSDVTVQSVRSGEGRSFGSSGEGQNVVISVAPTQASRVVAAQSIDDAQVRAGVLSGGTQPSEQPSSVPSDATSDATAGSSGSPGLPADLAACGGK